MTMKICLNLMAVVVFLLSISLSSRISAEIRNGSLALAIIRFVHYFAFSSWLGTQLWATFIAGATMYYNMPRHAFGDIQSKLFPKYFLSGSVLSVTALATYCLLNPREMWSSSEYYQVAGLAVSLGSCLINFMYLEPKTFIIMRERYSYEKERGYGDEIGPITEESLKKDEKYIAMTHRFACVHGLSSMLNIMAFTGCLIHLWISTALKTV